MTNIHHRRQVVNTRHQTNRQIPCVTVHEVWESPLAHGRCGCKHRSAWWPHEMETFSALLAICAENSPFPGEFPAQRPVTRSFDAFFDLRLNKRLSKQSWGWWFETPSRPLWRHRNVIFGLTSRIDILSISRDGECHNNSPMIGQHCFR